MKLVRIIFSFLVLCSGANTSAAEPSARDYAKLGEYLVGTWKWEMRGTSGTITFTMSPTKQCVTSIASLDGKALRHAIEGYVAEKQGWVRTMFWTDGRHSVSVTKMEKAPTGDSLAGVTLVGTVHDSDSLADAKDSKVTYRIKNSNEWEVEREDGTVVFKRQKE